MAVIACSVCGTSVNAEAIACPSCGSDPHLGEAEAKARRLELTSLEAGTRSPVEPPLPGWTRRRRVLAALPGLVLPGFLVGLGIAEFVWGWSFYWSLSPAERAADGDPFPADAFVWFSAVIVIAGLLASLPLLFVVVPRRLPGAFCVIAVVLGLLQLMLVDWLTVRGIVLGLGGVMMLAYLYAPGLGLLRLYLQSRQKGVTDVLSSVSS